MNEPVELTPVAPKMVAEWHLIDFGEYIELQHIMHSDGIAWIEHKAVMTRAKAQEHMNCFADWLNSNPAKAGT